MLLRRNRPSKVSSNINIDETYSVFNPDEIPYIDDITNSIDYASIENPNINNLLEHNMALSNELPGIVSKLKKKYKS